MLHEVKAVSYTHLDVYKRQIYASAGTGLYNIILEEEENKKKKLVSPFVLPLQRNKGL